MSAHERRGGRRAWALGLLSALLATPAAASACSFAVGPGYDPVGDAHLAITGRVTALRYLGPRAFPGSGEDERYVATIRVHRVYVGASGPTVRVRGSTDEGLCGFGRLRVGQRLGLAITATHAPFTVGIAARVRHDQLERHGPSRPPQHT